MSAVPKPFLTPREYLLREDAAPFRSEYFNGEMFAMAGASPEHDDIEGNLRRSWDAALAGKDCRENGANLRIKIDATGLYTYADSVVTCGRREYETIEGVRTLVNPTVIVEILSDSTERYDRTTKFDHYRKIPSLRDCLLVSQREPRVEHFSKAPDGSWTHQAGVGIDAVVELRSVGVALRLADIYARVDFAPAG